MAEICAFCARPVQQRATDCDHGQAVTSYVVHDSYGCDSGCCGHRIIGLDKQGQVVFSKFDFGHPYHSTKDDGFWQEWAHMLARTLLPTATFDWEKSNVSDD
jgi:hypothetical protein